VITKSSTWNITSISRFRLISLSFRFPLPLATEPQRDPGNSSILEAIGSVTQAGLYWAGGLLIVMRKFWLIFFFLFGVLFLAGCAAKKKPVAPPQPAAPPPVRSQMPPPSAEVIEHCVVSKHENANTVTCRCEPVTTRIDSKTGHTVIVCKKMPEKR
jgi:hypothetical protein